MQVRALRAAASLAGQARHVATRRRRGHPEPADVKRVCGRADSQTCR
jgi:hypothetical protein